MANSIAYGFMGLKDLFKETVADNIAVVQTALEEWRAAYEEENSITESVLVQKTTAYSIRYQLVGSGTLQPLDQWGNPLPVLPSGYYDVGLPIQGGGTAWGDNRVTRALMTIADANRFAIQVQAADVDWRMRHILAAIFTNVTWSYVDDDHGTLTIQPLANGDTVTYTRKSGTSAIDTHYLAQAAAIADATNPYPLYYAELAEHPSNSAPYVSYIPTALKATTMALASFVDVNDPDITPASGSATLTGSMPTVIGGNIIGKADGMWIAEWERLPADIIVSVAQGSDPVVGMREYPSPAIQGLFPEFQNVDGNRFLNKFIRYAGYGVVNRVGAVVGRIGNGAYAIPTGYTAPLPV